MRTGWKQKKKGCTAGLYTQPYHAKIHQGLIIYSEFGRAIDFVGSGIC